MNTPPQSKEGENCIVTRYRLPLGVASHSPTNGLLAYMHPCPRLRFPFSPNSPWRISNAS